MRLTSIIIKNFKMFRDVEIKNIPKFCAFVGMNNAGKSQLFEVFDFLKNVLKSGLALTLGELGGFDEVLSENASEQVIRIQMTFQRESDNSSTYYSLWAQKDEDKCVTSNISLNSDLEADRDLETWIKTSYFERSAKTDFNLNSLICHLYDNEKDTFGEILAIMKNMFPDLEDIFIESDDDKSFTIKENGNLFKPEFMSVGVIRALYVLSVLYGIKSSLFCIERPEANLNGLIHERFAKELREYAERGAQVFISTHSPEFLNGVELEEVFWFEKRDGYAQIKRASDDKQIRAYMENGDKMGALWRQGFFGDVNG